MPSAEVDSFPMKCKECDIMQKTVKGLKMHIKLMHLRNGRFRCRRCEFSANILNSIHMHYKIKHPEADQDRPDFEERANGDKAKVFSHDYWKDTWGIPTLAERKAIVAARSGGGGDQSNPRIPSSFTRRAIYEAIRGFRTCHSRIL